MRWWRLFLDKLSGRRRDPDGINPRRRKAERYPFAVSVTARCASWPKVVEMLTADVSDGGMFVPTDQSADLGERIEVELTLPDQGSLKVTGKVVNIIDAALAAQRDKERGLGLELDPLEGEDKLRFDEILAAARAAAPVPPEPELTPTESPPPATVLDDDDDIRLTIADFDEPAGSAATAAAALPTPKPIETPAAALPTPKPVKTPVAALPTPRPVKTPVVAPPTPKPVESPVAAPPTPKPIESPVAAPPTPKPSRPAASKPADSAEIVVGIDLGTSFTSVAAVDGRKVKILPWPDGIKSSPSVISFPSAHEIIVGMAARMRLATDPKHTVVSPKRLLGRGYTDQEIQSFLGSAPYRTLAGPDGSVVIDIWGEQYAITQLCTYLLEDVKRVATAALGREVTQCVMTVPVSFDESRTKILRHAAKLARLEVIALIDEPSAAALANRFDPGFGGIVGIYDFGGGTFDFSVVDVSKGDFLVLATAGDTWLGGDDFDLVLAEAAANQFWRTTKVDLRRQAVEWQRLLFACERAKRMLSVDDESIIFVPEALRTAEGMIDLNISLDRATFERACGPINDRALATCDEALALLDMKPTDLSAIYLSGGTTYIPAVRAAVARHFQVPVRTGVPPEHAVCLGAAIHAAQLQYQRGATTLDSRDD